MTGGHEVNQLRVVEVKRPQRGMTVGQKVNQPGVVGAKQP